MVTGDDGPANVRVQDTSTNSDAAVYDEPADNGPRTMKVRIGMDAAEAQPIGSPSSDGILKGGNSARGNPSVRRSRPPPLASFTGTLPSTGLDVLLIGRTDLCRPLAESMLSVTFDRQRVANTRPSGRHGKNKRPRQELSASTTKGRGDPAIEALRRHLCRSSATDTTGGGSRRVGGIASFGLADAVRARHVRLVESLSDLVDGRRDGNEESKASAYRPSDSNAAKKEPQVICTYGDNKAEPRFDHAVIVLTPTDPFSSTRLRQAAVSLHPDYATQGRVTIVYALGGKGDSTSDGPAKAACPGLVRLLEDVEQGAASKFSGLTKGGSAGDKTSMMSLFATSVPVLRCNLKESHSRLAVARMVMQRTKMGSRGCMGADDGLDVVVTNASDAGDGGSNAAEGDVSGALKHGIGGTKGGISPLFFSSIL